MVGPCPTWGGGTLPPTLILSCEIYDRGPIRYVIDLEYSGIQFYRVALAYQAGQWFTVFPKRPKLTAGKAKPRKGGGYISQPVIEIPDPRLKNVFDRAVLSAFNHYRKKGSF